MTSLQKESEWELKLQEKIKENKFVTPSSHLDAEEIKSFIQETLSNREKEIADSMPEPLKKDWKKEIRKDYHKILPEEQIEDTVKYWDEIINGALQSQKDSLLEKIEALEKPEAIHLKDETIYPETIQGYNQCLEEVKKIIKGL